MDVRYQLSPVNFTSESSSLPSAGIKLTLFFLGGVCHWIYTTPLSNVPLELIEKEIRILTS